MYICMYLRTFIMGKNCFSMMWFTNVTQSRCKVGFMESPASIHTMYIHGKNIKMHCTNNICKYSSMSICIVYLYVHMYVLQNMITLNLRTVINPWRACAARVMVVGSVCVCVCVSVKSHLSSGASVRPENTVTYSAGKGG